ncbi:Similar to CTPsyn: CTP synthase (Drosophila melanogaster) [Cotesia congregata]|uniref:CTP synthase n=1 Tax=Cotesia congregata TaxID=51543 RepID=A0A8J2H5I5_COTCN|nr:Similar to CTPsyn: CTP synthase (Drosophila melanogaster) [Cotesia congregata]
MKYILVTGGVISGIGKGVIASSFGTILKECGIAVTSIKIDPYINIDAGTFSPYEHEVDLDLGNYERFLDITLHRDNNITTGKVYQHVINKERHGDYLGKTVQVVPHITDCIQEWVERVSQQPVTESNSQPRVCVIELGGTIGDIEGMPFVEAFRQFQFRVKKENFCVAHVSLVPQPRSTGEPKTKPTQASVRELRGLGLSPDLIVCRSEQPIGPSVKDKVSNFCHVAPEQVITIHDLSSIYRVPLLMESQGVIEFLNERLQLDLPHVGPERPRSFMRKWRDLSDRFDHLRKKVNIALVGKYTKLEDAYASVTKALQHASLEVGYKLNLTYIEAANLENATLADNPVLYHEAWQKLCKSDGVIVPGGFGKRGIEGKISACKWCRVNSKPMLGICLGLQVAVIEFARNVLGLEAANKSTPSVIKALYGNVDGVEERHRHRYEVNPVFVSNLEAAGLKFVGQDTTGQRMEIIELEGHDYYVATQYHPEYLSRPMKPSAPFLGLILASVGKLKSYLAKGCRLTPRNLSDNDSDEEDKKIVKAKETKSD